MVDVADIGLPVRHVEKGEQLALVTLADLPERPDLLEAIEARPVDRSRPKWRHTGRRFLDKLAGDTDLAEMVIMGFKLGFSVRLLAWRLGVSPNTLAAARRLMTDRDELEPVRKRQDRLLDEVGEEGLEYWLEGMRTGVIHPGQITIPTLAALTNKGQRDVGLVPGTERTVEGVGVERARAFLELVKLRATEGVSGGKSSNGPIIEAEIVRDTASRTAEAAPAATARPVGGGATDGAAASGEGPGGGSHAAPAQGTRWEGA